MRNVLITLALVCATWAPSGGVHAQTDFWQRFSHDKTARAQTLARRALRVLKHEQPSLLDPTSHLFPYRVSEALDQLARAVQLAPNDSGILMAYGLALARHRPQDSEARQTALRALEAARRGAPQKFSYDEYFELAILYSREQRFDQAIATYERLLREAIEPPSITTLSNLAEMRMMSGDLAGAIGGFRKALAQGTFDPGSDTLARWGLGVALDRMGQHLKAIEEVKQAVQNSGGTLRTLDADGVFFEPDFERHWYRGLGYEALATTHTGLRKEEFLYSAELEWEAFAKRSAASGTPSPWQSQAEAHTKRLQEQRKKLRSASKPGAPSKTR